VPLRHVPERGVALSPVWAQKGLRLALDFVDGGSGRQLMVTFCVSGKVKLIFIPRGRARRVDSGGSDALSRIDDTQNPEDRPVCHPSPCWHTQL
jgi:hypothetical protein